MVYKRKYKVNKNELKKYFQDLTELEDWILYIIRMELPKGYSLKLGKNATNKDLLSKRLLEHKLENSRSTMNGHKLMDYEIDIFIRKYSYFTSLFDKLELFDLKGLIILYIE